MSLAGSTYRQPRRPRKVSEDLRSVSSIVIRKSQRRLDLLSGNRVLKSYRAALGFEPVGDKSREGDGKTPEGEFYVCARNPESKYHLSLCLSYPAEAAARQGLEAGLIDQGEFDQIIKAAAERSSPPQRTGLGGEIYIHGGGTENDWTDGCVAVRNEDMTEIFQAAAIGTKVIILP